MVEILKNEKTQIARQVQPGRKNVTCLNVALRACHTKTNQTCVQRCRRNLLFRKRFQNTGPFLTM